MEKILDRINLLKGDYSIREFASIIGMPPQTFDNYVSKRRKISLWLIDSVCKGCNVSADWLLGYSKSRTGTCAPVPDPVMLAKIKELEEQVASLTSELESVKGENTGLRFALKALGRDQQGGD
jgi:hypothetical protein